MTHVINNGDVPFRGYEEAVHGETDHRRSQSPEKRLTTDNNRQQRRAGGVCRRNLQTDQKILDRDEVIPDLNIMTPRALGGGLKNIVHEA